MEIKIDGSNLSYQLNIQYHFKSLNGMVVKIFPTFDSFGIFMGECHPDVDFGDLGNKFSKRVELVTRLGNSGIADSNYLNSDIHCFISGNSLIACHSETGIMEKMYEHYTTSEKVNEGYLHTFLAHQWEFGRKDSQSYVKYWFDSNNKDEQIHKIHCFNNKVVFEKPNGTICSMIVNSNYYIHYEGEKRAEKKDK
jgi:hypothetical protein